MARRKTKAKTKSKKRRQTRSENNGFLSRYLANIIGAVLTLLLLVGLFDLGALGNVIEGAFQIIVGWAAPAAIIIALIYSISYTLVGHRPHLRWRWIIGTVLIFAGALLVLHGRMFDQLARHTDFINVTWNNINRHVFNGDSTGLLGGGMIGAYLYSFGNYLVARIGTLVLAWLLIIIGVVVFFSLPVDKMASGLKSGLVQGGQKLQAGGQKLAERRAAKAANQPKSKRPRITMPTLGKKPQESASKAPTAAPEQPAPEATAPVKPTINVASNQPDAPESLNNDTSSSVPADKAGDDINLAQAEEKADEDYKLPPMTLLSPSQKTDQSADIKAIDHNTKKLQDTLQSFGVQATVENVNLGPSVTKYELRPAVGVKVSRITHLADDLALALAAKDIRIEAPIPGKSLIGIEVPNKKVATVGFRDMLENAPHDNNPMEVPIGRAVTGKVIMADLTKMPHLLIAGATGSGKSVAINVILTSILMKAKPHQVKFLLIDPKKVELSVYNDIPHLLSPVVSEPKKAAKALGKVVAEMERRYELFSNFGVRNIGGYNNLVKKQNEQDEGEKQPYLPFVLVVVDELSDLMMTVSNDVENAIVRIAQMGRAAGIHMILATQRPSVDVITGLIKANVPSRMAFAVSSGVDSRTILDTNGAEKLLGRGDMLFQPIDQNKPVRIQGAFISDHDVESVVDFIKKERPAEYDKQMVVTDSEVKADEAAEDQDELFPDAVKFVVDQQKASTSLIQRRFRVGYNRAARIIDDMEQQGIIGPANGSKPREVLRQPNKDEQ
ncbi:DNA translocase FtsK [Limosilactobacillus sp.]|uniref:DNA translocase FtsK n=1 Tax=Limosilactobacillus sp. TaxID=2773925 RepID=UPI00345ECD11